MDTPEGEPDSWYSSLSSILLFEMSGFGLGIVVASIMILLLFSAFLSGSEVAFFSLNGEAMASIKEQKQRSDSLIKELLNRPRTLLATILIGNNVVNIAIVILSTILTDALLHFELEWLQFLVQVVVVTLLLVLFGEVLPKLYANQFNLQMARIVAAPMLVLVRLLKPFSFLLVRSSRFIEKRMNQHQQELTVQELNQAIELTSDDDTSVEEKKILKGVVNFGNTTVKEIMRSRHDVMAYDKQTSFPELVSEINHNRYSRLPIYDESLDNIVGVLYSKDLLPHLGEGPHFDWTSLVRKAFFVPEMMKIDDLLTDFKERKVHMAIVVDEYGGTEGIVTLEDVLEEIVGEINDEFDETEIYYSRLDEQNVVFNGKTSLTDVRKVLNLEPDFFDAFKSEVESIGGLMTELAEEFPVQGQALNYRNLDFVVESTKNRTVQRVKVTVKENFEEE